MAKYSKITAKRAMLNVVERLMDELSYQEKNNRYTYKCVGKETEQAIDRRTGELLWEDEDHKVPKYLDKWEDVEVFEDEMSDDQLATIQAIKEVRAALEKMI